MCYGYDEVLRCSFSDADRLAIFFFPFSFFFPAWERLLIMMVMMGLE